MHTMYSLTAVPKTHLLTHLGLQLPSGFAGLLPQVVALLEDQTPLEVTLLVRLSLKRSGAVGFVHASLIVCVTLELIGRCVSIRYLYLPIEHIPPLFKPDDLSYR